MEKTYEKIAVYLDYENIRKSLEMHHNHIADPSKVSTAVMKAAGQYGRVLCAYAYGDWALLHPAAGGGRVKSAALFQTAGFEPIMVPVKPSGQDRTDLRLALDAQRALFKRPEVTAFLIVSGDGDYGVLAREIRLEQRRVMVCGIGKTMSRELISLADPLITFESLLGLTPPQAEMPEPSASPKTQFEWVPFIVAVDKATKMNWDFVGFKHFRDKWLTPEMGADSNEKQHELMNEAVSQQIIETYPVVNPKNPSFRTTAIRLNKTHPLVQATLKIEGEASSAAAD